ncbi:DedA family protein [bacterium]|nr:DedA family protein [bacterium]
MINIAVLAQTYGYPVIVLGTMLQGETILLMCGFLAHRGYLSLWLVVLIAAISAACGDTTYFFIGRKYGEKFLSRLPKKVRSPLLWAQDMTNRHPARVLLSMRFLLEMRILMPIVCGMSSIRSSLFFRYNIPTAFVWAGVFVGIGYLFGAVANSILHDIEDAEIFLILALALLGYLYYLFGRQRRKKETP